MGTVATSDTVTNPQYFGNVVQAVPLQAPALALLGSAGLAPPTPGSITNPGLRVSWQLEPERGVENEDGVVEVSTVVVRNNVNTQEYNVIQDFHEAISESYASEAAIGEPAGNAANIAAIPNFIGITPSRFEKQIGGTLRAVAKAIDKKLFRGVRAYTAGSDTARVMGGWFNMAGSDANYKDYGTAEITLASFIQHLANSYDVGALRGSGEYICFASTSAMVALTKALHQYRVLPSGTEANYVVDTFATPFGRIKMVLAPNTFSYSYCIVDMAEQRLIGNNKPGQGNFFIEKLAPTKKSEDVWRLWGNLTLEFGHPLHIVAAKNVGGTSA